MITLVLPPLTQLNTPYPSTAFLARFLRRQGFSVAQRDLGLELVLRLFSKEGLRRIFDHVETLDELPEPAWRALALRAQHEAAIEPVIRFLQGRDRTLAPRILDTPLLPKGPRLAAAELDGFGPLSVEDTARHLATLYLADLADLVTACVDDGFGLARYHHHLAASVPSFDPLAERLAQTTVVDAMLDALGDSIETPLVGLSVPFPGNLYGALRLGRRLRARGVYVVMGGGYVNTELRAVDEPRLWECVDALCLDDGEGPLMAILDHVAGRPDRRHRTRTRTHRFDAAVDVPAGHLPDYGGLRLGDYLQLIDGPNPAHRLWSDGRWNKVMVAHGCYWKKCSFCDIQLPYIRDYVPAATVELVDGMEALIEQTGTRGFHLVDEAAPPRGLRDLALELLRRRATVSWWGNIRFETTFTADLARLLAASGCVALTGGLEVASDRLLARMQKGVDIDQVVAAAWNLRQAGILVHAYLMFGFPTETEQECVDSMEVVRQMFANGVLSSAFWHRFVLTRHSGIAPDPAAFGITIPDLAPRFADNDLDHLDPSGADHDRFDAPLATALAAWMRGQGLDVPLQAWFDHPIPRPTVPADRVARAIPGAGPFDGRLVWLGGEVLEDDAGLVLHHADGTEHVPAAAGLGELLVACTPGQPPLRTADVPIPPTLLPRLRRAGLVAV